MMKHELTDVQEMFAQIGAQPPPGVLIDLYDAAELRVRSSNTNVATNYFAPVVPVFRRSSNANTTIRYSIDFTTNLYSSLQLRLVVSQRKRV
jgi:hypothetical protein